MFATMLTRPRINADDVTPSRRGEKYVHYYTVVCSRQYLQVESLSAKIPLLRIVAINARYQPHANLTPPWSHVKN
jgi:hypothetical protein